MSTPTDTENEAPTDAEMDDYRREYVYALRAAHRDRKDYRAEVLKPVRLWTGADVDARMTERQRKAAVDLVTDAVEVFVDVFGDREPDYDKTLRYLLENGFVFNGGRLK